MKNYFDITDNIIDKNISNIIDSKSFNDKNSIQNLIQDIKDFFS